MIVNVAILTLPIRISGQSVRSLEDVPEHKKMVDRFCFCLFLLSVSP